MFVQEKVSRSRFSRRSPCHVCPASLARACSVCSLSPASRARACSVRSVARHLLPGLAVCVLSPASCARAAAWLAACQVCALGPASCARVCSLSLHLLPGLAVLRWCMCELCLSHPLFLGSSLQRYTCLAQGMASLDAAVGVAIALVLVLIAFAARWTCRNRSEPLTEPDSEPEPELPPARSQLPSATRRVRGAGPLERARAAGPLELGWRRH